MGGLCPLLCATFTSGQGCVLLPCNHTVYTYTLAYTHACMHIYTHTVYLRSSPEVCYQRLQERGRKEEKPVTLVRTVQTLQLVPHIRKLVLTHSMEDYVISHKTTGLLIIVWTISFNGYTLTFKVRLNTSPIVQGVVYEPWLHLGINLQYVT